MTWDVTEVPDDPDNGHIAANDAIGEVIEGVSAPLDVDLSDDDVLLTADEFTFHLIFNCSGHSATRAMTIPSDIEKEFVVKNDGTGTVNVTHGTTDIAVGAGQLRRFYTDGTANDLIALDAGAASSGDADSGTIYDFGFSFEATPDAGAILGRVRIGRDITIPADFDGALGGVATPPGATWEVEVNDDGALIGTISVSDAGVVTFAGVGSPPEDITVAAGSVITFEAPSGSPAEGNVAGGSFVILARVT